VEIDNAVGAVSPQGSASVSPPDDTTYTLTASNGGGTRTATATIVVNDPPPVPPVINSFTANPTEIVAGGSSTLQWEVTGSEPLAVNLDNGIGAVEAVSSLEVSPDTTTSYTLTASNTAGNISNTVTLTVTIPDEPASVVSFAADPATIELGDSSTLTWSATGTLPLEISLFENGVLLADGLDVSGSFPVTPTSEGSYSYTLTAGNEAGSDSAESEVTVLLPDDGGDDEDEG
jgi:PKD repeat protein